MEGHSEAIFDSLSLNPQMFINEVINTIDGLVDEAFESYEREASNLVGGTESEKSEKLQQGVSSLRHMMQAVLDKQLDGWEKYCLQHVFVVPDEFSLHKAETSGKEHLSLGDTCVDELDTCLDSLRERLDAYGRESTALKKELQALESQSAISSNISMSVKDALEPFGQNAIHYMFQEMVKNVTVLRKKMVEVERKRHKERERITTEMLYNPSRNLSSTDINGLSVTLKDLQDFVDSSNVMLP
ncbi:protein MIS12 homolog [Aristolochia californica]|uniref:protein MIS12 homolog n=1 Tax=Aristolochia californica TaxID=171875 RepID=UPI0035E09A55